MTDHTFSVAQSTLNSQLAEFFTWAMRDGPWDGGDLDGGSVQDKAESLGLIVKTQYDPEKHGMQCDFEEGDDYFEFAPDLLAAKLPAATVDEETRFHTDKDREYAVGLLDDFEIPVTIGDNVETATQWFCKARVETARRIAKQRPQCSAERDREGELDFSIPTTNRIMGAVRLHTHDHTMAYNITRDVLAVLNEPQPPSKMLTMLAILDAAGGQTEASDSKWCWLNYFCEDAEPTDTFNRAVDAKLIRVTHDSRFDSSTVYLTDAGRAACSLTRPQSGSGK